MSPDVSLWHSIRPTVGNVLTERSGSTQRILRQGRYAAFVTRQWKAPLHTGYSVWNTWEYGRRIARVSRMQQCKLYTGHTAWESYCSYWLTISAFIQLCFIPTYAFSHKPRAPPSLHYLGLYSCTAQNPIPDYQYAELLTTIPRFCWYSRM